MTTGKIRCGDFTWMMRIALTAIIVVAVTLSGNPVYSACESADNIPTHPVVYNLKMKSIGIITGKLWLKLKDMQDVPSIADMYNIPLYFANNEMSTAFYDIPGDVNIQTLRKQLEADTRVLRVTLDMVDVIQHLK